MGQGRARNRAATGGSGPAPPVIVEDASGFRGEAERAFTPATENELAAILADASRHAIPVTIVGAATGVTGGAAPRGGWSVSTAKLTHLEIHDGRAIAGAGVPLAALHAAATATKQLYGPDPTETTASIGGTVATNASGSRSFRYGDTRRNLVALRVATMDGAVREFRRGQPIDFDVRAIPAPRTTKHAAGFPLAPGMDWVDLFAGSEGALGVVTEAEMKLVPRPAALLSGVVFFGDEETALDAVDSWRGVDRLRMLEFFDAASLRLLETPGGAALIVEQEMEREDGPEVDEWAARLEAAGAVDSWIAASDRDRERFRRFRHALPEAVNAAVRRNGFLKVGSDCAVPVAGNRGMMRYYRRRLEAEFPGRAVIFGHIGDAHVHVNVLPSSAEEFERGQRLMLEFAREAVARGGTVSAEHGLGKRKAHLLRIQYEEDAIEAMRAVKRRLDPGGLLGPGNLL